MRYRHINRRNLVRGGAALGAATLLSKPAIAQPGAAPPQADRPPAALPNRGEFVVRGAFVVTMDPNLGELPRGDIHVRAGAIVAVRENIAAPGVETIDGSGMICMPGFVETH